MRNPAASCPPTAYPDACDAVRQSLLALRAARDDGSAGALRAALLNALPLLNTGLPDGPRRTLEAAIDATREAVRAAREAAQPPPSVVSNGWEQGAHRHGGAFGGDVHRAPPACAPAAAWGQVGGFAPSHAPLRAPASAPAQLMPEHASPPGVVRAEWLQVRTQLPHSQVGYVMGPGGRRITSLRTGLEGEVVRIKFSEPQPGAKVDAVTARELTIVGTHEGILKAVARVNGCLPDGERAIASHALAFEPYAEEAPRPNVRSMRVVA